MFTFLSYDASTSFGIAPPKKPAEMALLEELEHWKVLPHMGGYLDKQLTLMADLRTVDNARSHYMAGKAAVANSGLQKQIDDLKLTIPGM